MNLDFRTNPDVLKHVVDATATGMFTVDADGKFVAWNRAAERITGYSVEEVRGQPCHLLEGPQCKGFGRVAELIRTPPPAGTACEQQCRIVAKNGHELYIHGNLSVVRDEDQVVVGAVGTFMDITSVVQAHEKIELLESQRARDSLGRMVGKCNVMQEVFRRLRLAADSDVTVLITGESGTGKELAAEAVHLLSPRRNRPFVAVNCSAMPETLLESELFGHVKGAFTGAHRDKLGVFQAADGGTLFLDEVAEVSAAIQVKLLRVLQEREIRRVGEERVQQVDVRLLAATNKDLRQLVQRGEVREDFFYRIHVFEVHLPPLRERKGDIPLLVERFLTDINKEHGKQVDGVSRDAMQLMMEYHWPGNIRQLRNAIEHAMVTVAGDRISFLDLPREVRDPHHATRPGTSSHANAAESAERERIVEALRTTGGNRTQAAKLLGTSRVTLWKKINRYAIEE